MFSNKAIARIPACLDSENATVISTAIPSMKTVPLTIIATIISLILVFVPGTAVANRRSKRDNTENFNVLLSIYKMNPLKHSNVFKTFSNHILLPGPDERRAALNFNINESHESREKENSTNTKLKNEELINHATHKAMRPLYIEEGTPENFKQGRFLSKLVSMNQIDTDLEKDDDSDIFNDDLIQTHTIQSEKLNNYVNRSENAINRRYIKKTPETNRNFKVLSNVSNKVPFDIEETIIVKKF